MYQITITRLEPRSEKELEEIKQAEKYNRDYPFPSNDYSAGRDMKVVRVLNTILTDEEFKQVKKSVIEIM